MLQMSESHSSKSVFEISMSHQQLMLAEDRRQIFGLWVSNKHDSLPSESLEQIVWPIYQNRLQKKPSNNSRFLTLILPFILSVFLSPRSRTLVSCTLSSSPRPWVANFLFLWINDLGMKVSGWLLWQKPRVWPIQQMSQCQDFEVCCVWWCTKTPVWSHCWVMRYILHPLALFPALTALCKNHWQPWTSSTWCRLS